MLDANIAYLVLLASLWLVISAIHFPGTGMFEVLALVVSIIAVALLISMPTNWGAAVLVVSGMLSALVTPFFGRQYEWIAVGGMILAAVAASFLFTGMAISPAVILLMTSAGLIFQRFALLPTIEHQRAHPAMLDDQPIVGMRGYVHRALNPVGTVYVQGELWTARASSSDTLLTEGAEIVVVERDGLTLLVEPVKQKRTEISADEHLN